MHTYLIYCLMTVLAGGMIASQSPINAALAKYIGGPIWGAFASFLIGTIALFIFALSVKGIPEIQTSHIRPWMLLGGLLGAYFVANTILVVPVLGVTTLITLIVAGQLGMALYLDHIGFLGVTAEPVTLRRVAGVALVFIGALLARKV